MPVSSGSSNSKFVLALSHQERAEDRRLQTLQRFLLEQLHRELNGRQGELYHVMRFIICLLVRFRIWMWVSSGLRVKIMLTLKGKARTWDRTPCDVSAILSVKHRACQCSC